MVATKKCLLTLKIYRIFGKIKDLCMIILIFWQAGRKVFVVKLKKIVFCYFVNSARPSLVQCLRFVFPSDSLSLQKILYFLEQETGNINQFCFQNYGK